MSEEDPLQMELFSERLVTEAERPAVRHDIRLQRRVLMETIRAHTEQRLVEVEPNKPGRRAIRRDASAVRRFVNEAAEVVLAEIAGAELTIAAATAARGRLSELIEKLSAQRRAAE